jgi:hypothetical protein
MNQPPVTPPAREGLGAEDTSPYRTVRIYDNISFSMPGGDDVPSVSNATSKDEEEGSGSEKKAKQGSNASLETSHHSGRTKWRPKEKYHWEWFWFCCQCSNGPVAANGYTECCLEWNCGHTRCSGCSLQQQKVRDRA